jgi:YcaO-like protein with predicted kinase domain
VRALSNIRFFGEPATRLKMLAGTWRTATPQATWHRFCKWQKRIGITRIADVTGLDTIGIPVFSAIRPMGLSLSSQQGKGVTQDAARVSALMESIETWHAEHLILPTQQATYAEMLKQDQNGANQRCVDPRLLPSGMARWRPSITLTWVPGTDLITGDLVSVPNDVVTLNCVFGKRKPVFDINSTGLASGNSMTEAAIHGLCEVIEREAEATWRCTGEDNRLLLESVSDPICLDILTRLHQAGIRVWAWLLSSCADIPVVAVALSQDPRRPRWRQLGVYQGFGCHPHGPVALSRALTEAVQTRLTYIAGGRDDFFPADYQQATSQRSVKRFWQRYSQPADNLVDCGIDSSFAMLRKPTSCAAMLATLLEQVRAAGCDNVIAVDLRQPRMKVPVVKIIVPGLGLNVQGQG